MQPIREACSLKRSVGKSQVLWVGFWFIKVWKFMNNEKERGVIP
jgi:hypothetical protein